MAACLDGCSCATGGQRRLSGQSVSEIVSSRIKLVARDDAVGQPDSQSVSRIDDFAEQDQFPCAALADDTRKPEGGTHVRQQAVTGLGETDPGILGKDPKVARQSKLKTCAVGVTPDGRDTGAGEIRDEFEDSGDFQTELYGLLVGRA